MAPSDSPSDPGASDGEHEVFRGQYDWASISPSNAVVRTLAVATGRDPTAIEPLYGYVDPEALDGLVGSNGKTRAQGPVVSFPFDGHEITVHGDGVVVVRTAGVGDGSV